MIKNYLKIALRHIRKNTGFSLLNMLGLALGLTCAMLILIWIKDEVTYNSFHKKYDDLYQVMENQEYEGKTYTFGATPGLLAAAMKTEFPEVRNAARMGWGERSLFNLKGKPIYEDGNYADPAIFQMFSFKVIYGNAKDPLPDDHSIVLTKKMSEKFFGKENPVGRYLKIDNKYEFVITAVVEDFPQNSSLRFQWIVHFRQFETRNSWWQYWGNNGMLTYVELAPGTSVSQFNKKFKGYIRSKDAEANAQPLLLPMKDWRLRSNFEEGKQVGGRIEYVRLFGTIAGLLILIACINFMNLATARSEQRAREVGVRKVMGALRRNLMMQFIGEALVMAFCSSLLAILCVVLTLPAFNELVGKHLETGLAEPVQWLSLFAITVLCGIIAGSYPAIFLSSFKPISIFKGIRHNKTSGVVLVRKGLVVTQFVISIALIVSTVVIYRQIEHVKKRQLGYNKDRLLYVMQQGKMNENMDVIAQDLHATGVVDHAATSNQRLMQMGNNRGGISWEGKNPSKDVLITVDYVSPDYVKTAGMKLVSGRDFYSDPRHDSTNVIINETFAKIIGAKDPVNSILNLDSTKYTVVGVVQDFIFNNMYQKPDPVLIFCQPRSTNYYFVRLKEDADIENALAKVGDVFKKDNPGYPFEYYFLDADFDQQFRSEMLISKLSRLFAVITIVISCLGLFGLAAYTAERRTKEIGIRKVLGASVKNLVTLLSSDFIKLVLIAMVIATPLAWYLMHNWLQDFPYRIEIKVWMFFMAGTGALLIALITVSFQAIRAALTNPVKSLRTE